MRRIITNNSATNNAEQSTVIIPKVIMLKVIIPKVITILLIIPQVITILLITTLLITAPSAHAQTLSLGIYPPLLEVMIKPGKSVIQTFNVTNFGDPLILTSHLLPFAPRDELGNIHLQEETTPAPPALSWLSFQNADLSLGQSFFLNSGEGQQIILKIKIPENASEGDYYLSLVFASIPGGKRVLGAETRAKIATNILLTVSETGQPHKSAQIVELKVPKIVDSFDKIPVVLKVKNTGTAFLKPQGKVTLKGPLNLKANFPILPQNILVNSTRLLQASSSALPTTDYRLPTTLTLSGFFLGPYKILAKFSLDETGVSLYQETSFLALPFKLTLAFLIAIVFLFLVKKKVKEET